MIIAPLLLALSAPPDASGIAWLHDDWSAAKKKAQAEKKLVAVDVWATWCHTCLSMKSYVFTDRKLEPVAAHHVWLALDFDKEQNGAFFERFPVNAFPTFLVIDPKNDRIVARWAGSGTAQQMADFFGSAKRRTKGVLARGHRALAKGDYARAEKIFSAALKKKTDRTERTRLLAGYIEALWKLDQQRCAQVGMKHLKETDNSAPGIDFVSFVAYCAAELEVKEKRRILTAVRDRLAPIADDPQLPLSVDDRSSLYGTLTTAFDFLNEKGNATKATIARKKLLEEAAAEAATPTQRITFDAHRLEVYLRLKDYPTAEKMLRMSERNQPEDFNHPWRLAKLFFAAKKTDEGLKAIDRALQRGYGARRLRLFSTKFDLLIQNKEKTKARVLLIHAGALLKKLNKSQVRTYWVKELEAKEKALGD